jgi:hypothetical protein
MASDCGPQDEVFLDCWFSEPTQQRIADIRKVERRGDELVAETGRKATVVFRLAEEPRGWRLFTWEGDYPFRTLALHERTGCLSFSATLGPALDPHGPGVRGRLAFDLRSDLVALGKEVGTR